MLFCKSAVRQCLSGGVRSMDHPWPEDLCHGSWATSDQLHLAEQVQQLEARLKELEEERKELARFQQVDKQRRSLEYTIYDREAAETAAKLDQALLADPLVHDKCRERVCHEEAAETAAKLPKHTFSSFMHFSIE